MPTQIAVDEKVLAKVLGLPTWPADVPIDTDTKAMAARAVTDFCQQGTEPANAEDSLKNAARWIETAFELGVRSGVEREHGRWKVKLRDMFGL